MNKSSTRGIALLLSLLMMFTVAISPVYADEIIGGSGQSGTDQAESIDVPAGASQDALLPTGESEAAASAPGELPAADILTGDTEVLFTIPLGASGEIEDGMPATGGATAALQVLVNYPTGKTMIKQGDEISLLFKIVNYADDERFTGMTAAGTTGKYLENGIGAYKLTLDYSKDFIVSATGGATSNFTMSTTPKATFSFNDDKNGRLDIVGLFSEIYNGTVQSLNKTALNKTAGQFATVKLKFNSATLGGNSNGVWAVGISGSLAMVSGDTMVGDTITEVPVSGSPSIAFDTAAPTINAIDYENEKITDEQRNALQDIIAAPKTVDPYAGIQIKDESEFTILVKKGTLDYTSKVNINVFDKIKKFELVEPGTYTVTATDQAGNKSIGTVTVRPRITSIALAAKGTVNLDGTNLGYIGETYTVTPALNPAIATLLAEDKELIWTVQWTDGTKDDDFLTINGVDPSVFSRAEDSGVYSMSWKQTVAAPVTIAPKAFKKYTITVASAVTKVETTEPKAISKLEMSSPAKLISLTMLPENKKTNLSSVSEADYVNLVGTFTTLSPVTSGSAATPDDFMAAGLPITYETSNSSIVPISSLEFTSKRTVMASGKPAYCYDFTMREQASDNTKGICDVSLACGGKIATVTLNVTNYNAACTKMNIQQNEFGLDYSGLSESDFTIWLADPKNAANNMVVDPNDCYFTSSNTNLLTVSTNMYDPTYALVSAGKGAMYLSDPVKVTVTAELKDDPLGRKATAVYTVYPTDRNIELNIDSITYSNNIYHIEDYNTLYASSYPAEAQMSVIITGQQIQGSETTIVPANKKLVKFTTSNSKVATVSDTGLITVKGYGECTITVAATDGSNISDSLKVISHKPIEKLLSTVPVENNVLPGGKLQLKISGVTPADATNKSEISKAVWQIVSVTKDGENVNDQSDQDALLKIDAKGLLSVSATAANVEATIEATVSDKDFNDTTLISAPKQLTFYVKTAAGTAEQLKAFTKLTPLAAINLSSPTQVVVKVENTAFTDYDNIAWSLGTGATAVIDTEMADENKGIEVTATSIGTATLYASYMGKTLSVPITVYDDSTIKAAKFSIVSDAEPYLYDMYTTTELSLRSDSSAADFDVADCVFSSSMPNLVKVTDGVVTINIEQVILAVTKDTKVTITAALINDPYGRKATKIITVTPKILPREIESVDIFSLVPEMTSYGGDRTIEINLNTIFDKVFNLIIFDDMGEGSPLICLAPEVLRSFFEDACDTFESSGVLYNAALAGLTFTTDNKNVATVTAKGVVTLTGKPGKVTITAAQAAGTYAKGAAVPSASITLDVQQPCTAITLSQTLYTIEAGKAATLQLKATTTPIGGAVTWSSDSANITVDSITGKVIIPASSIVGSVTITATSKTDEDIKADCEIVVGAPGVTLAKVSSLTTAEKMLTAGTNGTMKFRSNASAIGDIHVTSSSPDVLTAAISADETINLGENKGYQAAVTPRKAGTATVTVAISGKIYSETFTVYDFANPSGSALLLTPSIKTLQLDASNDFNPISQYLTAAVIAKDKSLLNSIAPEDNEKYLTFTSSNPNLLAVLPDGTFYVRNLNTIAAPVNVTITAALKGEPKARTAKITFKVTPGVSVKKITIQSREENAEGDSYIIEGVKIGETAENKVIYTTLGFPGAKTNYSLLAVLDKTDDTTVMNADKTMVTWASTNTKVATVDANGNVAIKGKGTANITATAKDGSAVKDTVIIRVNQKPVVLNDVPRDQYGVPTAVTILSGGTYTIPYKLSTGLLGDYSIKDYIVTGADAGNITVDQKTGKITAKRITADADGITVTILFTNNNVYHVEESIESCENGDAVASSIAVPIKVVASPSVKSLGIYTSATAATAATTAEVISGTQLDLVIKAVDVKGAAISNFQDAVISVEIINYNVGNPSSPTFSRDGENIAFNSSPGSYRLNVSLYGKTTSCIVNVMYPWEDTSHNLAALTSKVKLTGRVVSSDGDAYNKINVNDIIGGIKIEILPTTGSTWHEWILAGANCTYTSNSPLVSVDKYGAITVAEYIPKETKVTITATLNNDPAKHVVAIPITVTSQRLTRSIVIKQGSTEVTGGTVTAIANNSTVRLTAYCSDVQGIPSDNRLVTWKSSNTKLAAVDKNGVVKLLGKGNVTITATASDGGGAYAEMQFNIT